MYDCKWVRHRERRPGRSLTGEIADETGRLKLRSADVDYFKRSRNILTMIVALDVHYGPESARAAGVLFEDWTSRVASVQVVEVVSKIEPYEPGSFYRRELPCLLALLGRLDRAFDIAIVDGYVWLGPANRPGLGVHLFEALNMAVPVIGVAKTPFRAGTGAELVFRGASRKPLYVTAVGIDVAQAAKKIESMHGPHRIPTILKQVDRLSRKTD